ncbi:MAG: FAD-binding oxidoreductase, partial [Pseudomonadota bacterium]|nr:FAD-binding oxidoreductase [Pseudomonadota bacterium]
MTRPSESPSWYRATERARRSYPKLPGDQVADVCIIGAGYTGLSAALELAKAGRRVIVLEAERVGFGASGRNGGQICTGFSPGQGPVRAQVGRDDARKCFALAEEAKALVEARIRTHGIECDLTWGYLHCAPKASKLRDLQEMQEEWQNEGYRDLQLLTKAELAHKLGTSAYAGALREGRAGHFHPLDYCNGLARAASDAGAEIHEQTRV